MELTYSVMPVLYGQPPLHPLLPPPGGDRPGRAGPRPGSATPSFPTGPTWSLWPWRGSELRLRVWERGSGETLACGTGACAALAAAHFLGLCPPEVTALLPGGSLVLSLDTASGHIRMTGPAVTVFEGEWPGG